jgi:hypothetical protein
VLVGNRKSAARIQFLIGNSIIVFLATDRC